MKTITVNNVYSVQLVAKFAQELLEENGPQVVTIQNAKNALSSKQRGTYWQWMTDIRKDNGEDEKRLHLRYKEEFLIGIFYRDDEGYRAMADAIREVQKHSQEDYENIREKVIALTSITDCSVGQMWEYMDKVSQHAHQVLNVTLRMPEDLQHGHDRYLKRLNNKKSS